MEYLALNNGVRMPLVGFGTWTLRGETGKRCILDALETGYRLLDTPQMYENEGIVGAAVRESGLARHEIFLTTKLFEPSASYENAKRDIEKSLSALGTDYIDLLLIHEPYDASLEMYRALCEAYRAGTVRAVGISSTAHSAARAVSFRRSIRSKRTFTIRANRCGARSSRTAPSCRHGRRSQKGNAVFLRSRC